MAMSCYVYINMQDLKKVFFTFFPLKMENFKKMYFKFLNKFIIDFKQ